jgi:putative endopeptidase
MKAKYLFVMVAALGLSACNQAPEQTSGLHLEYMDQTQKPGTDFFQFVNGGWQKLHPLPGDKARFATFDMLAEQASEALSTMVQDLAKAENAPGSNAQKVGDMFTLVMDSARLNAEGAEPIKDDMAEIAALKSQKDVYELLAKLNKRGVSAYYG